MDSRPRLRPTLNEVNPMSFEHKLKILNKEDVSTSTNEIQKRIDQINAKLLLGKKKALLTESEEEDPVGYVCKKQIIQVKEVEFVEKVRCYKTMQEVCAMVKK